MLLYMDLSGMKNYNYTNGFAEGDKLLLAFTEILVRTFGREQSCHIGADRFAAFTTVDGLEEKLTGFLQEAAVMNGGKTLPVQIGIYTTAMGKVPVTQAYDRAKMACDSLKNAGRSDLITIPMKWARISAGKSIFLKTSIKQFRKNGSRSITSRSSGP